MCYKEHILRPASAVGVDFRPREIKTATLGMGYFLQKRVMPKLPRVRP